VEAACIGLAGPVEGARARLTNLPWEVDAARVAAALNGARVTLVNDFVAAAAGVEALDASGLRVLQPGRADSGAPRLVVGAGTGLGTALIVPEPGGWRVFPGEGGHAGFAPRSELDFALLRWLRRRGRRAAPLGTMDPDDAGTRVRWEDLVSGGGIETAYRFLAQRDRRAVRSRSPRPTSPTSRPARSRWPSASEIAAAALAGVGTQAGEAGAQAGDAGAQAGGRGAQAGGRGDPRDAHEDRRAAVDARLAAQALDGFAAAFGAFAGDAALMTLPRGGVYLAGGIAPQVFDARRTAAFLEAFADKGGHARLLRALPVSLVLEPALGMLGAAVLAARAGPAVC